MRFWTLFLLLFLLLLFGLPAWALEKEGSIPEDLMAKRPPAPSEVYVAALPFWAGNERQTEQARACVMLNLLRHGFKLAPSGSDSLATVARRTDRAIKSDPKREPLARIGQQDAARLGKELGARWVVYGEIGELRTQSEKGFPPRKAGMIDLRLMLLDVPSGEIIYWSHVKDYGTGGSGFWQAKATAVERRLLTRAINLIFDDIAKALPEHYVSGEVAQETVRQIAELMGK
jgi:hypothetical protein